MFFLFYFLEYILSIFLCVKGEVDFNGMKMRAKKDYGIGFKMSFMRFLRFKLILRMVCFGWFELVRRN